MFRANNTFRGERPRLAPELLPGNAATSAVNARLQTGNLEAWRQFVESKVLEHTGSMPVRTIYLLKDKWLSWEADVDVARGAIAGDSTYRVFITAPDVYDVPQWTNYVMATTGAEPFPVQTRPLGVPAPDSAPVLEVGVDPTPTTFSIDITDAGDQLTTSWSTSPLVSSGSVRSEIVQSASVGNPLPSYEIVYEGNEGNAAWLYRNFGVESAAVVEFTADFRFTAGSGTRKQLLAHVMNTSTGNGITVGYSSDTGNLAIILASGWTSRSGSAIASAVAGALAFNTWYTVRVTVVVNGDATQTVTAKLYNGATLVAQTTATNTFLTGGYCGFVNETSDTDGSAEFRTYVDNIHVQASGAANYSPTNIATSYVFTFVNDVGQESAPGVPSLTILRPDGVSVTVTTPTTVPTGLSNDYSIETKRIYRAVTGSTGTVFRFVAEIDLTTADYVDTLADGDLGEVLPSDNWALPPDDLQGILALPNGIMAGFRENQLCLSVQNQSHAWPVEYRLNTDTKIVAIGNIDNTVVIGTQAFPYVATGVDPANYSMMKFEIPYACSSKRGLGYVPGIGVVYPSPDGMMAITGPGQARNLTAASFTRQQWQSLDPASIDGISHNGIYFMFWEANGLRGCYLLNIDPSNDEGLDSFGVVPMGFHATARFADPITDKLYLVLDEYDEPTAPYLPLPSSGPTPNSNTIFEFDADEENKIVYLWEGKLHLLDRSAAFMYGQVRAADYSNLMLRVYGGGELIFENVVANEHEFLIPVPDEYSTFEYSLIGTSRVRSTCFGETIEDLIQGST